MGYTSITTQGGPSESIGRIPNRAGHPSKADVFEQVSRLSISGDDDGSSMPRARDSRSRPERDKKAHTKTRAVDTGIDLNAIIPNTGLGRHSLRGRDLNLSYTEDTSSGSEALPRASGKTDPKKKRSHNIERVLSEMSSDLTDFASDHPDSSAQSESEKQSKRASKQSKKPYHLGFNADHTARVIELHRTLSQDGPENHAGIWGRITEQFCQEFGDFADVPDMAASLQRLYARATNKKREGPRAAPGHPVKWDSEHIDFTEEAIARDEPWKVVHRRFLETFPDMGHVTQASLKAGHSRWSYVRFSGGSKTGSVFSYAEKLKLFQVRRKYPGSGASSAEVVRAARKVIGRPEVSDEQIGSALRALKETSVEQLKQKIAGRKAEVENAKAKRVESNKNLEKQKAEYNRNRLKVWINVLKMFGGGRTSQEDATKQIMKSKEYRAVFTKPKSRNTYAVSVLYRDLRSKGTTVEQLEERLADIDAGKTAEAAAAMDELERDFDVRSRDPSEEDDNEDTLFIPERGGGRVSQGEMEEGMEWEPDETGDASLEETVYRQQLQARLDIEILTHLGELGEGWELDATEVIASAVYQNWLQGDNIPENVFDMLAERNGDLMESNVTVNELEEIARLDTVDQGYLTLWADEDPNG